MWLVKADLPYSILLLTLRTFHKAEKGGNSRSDPLFRAFIVFRNDLVVDGDSCFRRIRTDWKNDSSSNRRATFGELLWKAAVNWDLLVKGQKLLCYIFWQDNKLWVWLRFSHPIKRITALFYTLLRGRNTTYGALSTVASGTPLCVQCL